MKVLRHQFVGDGEWQTISVRVNPSTVTHVQPIDPTTHARSVVHFVGGSTLLVVGTPESVESELGL